MDMCPWQETRNERSSERSAHVRLKRRLLFKIRTKPRPTASRSLHLSPKHGFNSFRSVSCRAAPNKPKTCSTATRPSSRLSDTGPRGHARTDRIVNQVVRFRENAIGSQPPHHKQPHESGRTQIQRRPRRSTNEPNSIEQAEVFNISVACRNQRSLETDRRLCLPP